MSDRARIERTSGLPKPNPLTLALSLTPPMRNMLEQLVGTGLYGRTVEEAAERLVAESLRQLMTTSIVSRR